MVSKLFVAAVALLAFAMIIPAYSKPFNPCNPCCNAGPPLSLPLPLPASIPLGNICSCKPVALKPTLLPACSCPGAGLSPLLLKQLLPILLPSLLGAPLC